MVETIFAKDISLYELEEQFSLQPTDDSCFTEWLSDLPAVSESDKQALNRVRSNYLNLIKRRFMSEEAVKMVVLSPLLDLAGFYQPPFAIETETSIKISAEDEGVIVKGNIDVLVVQRQFWILVIEAKATKFDVMTALPQALVYMLDDPKREQLCSSASDRQTLGLLVNGREFVFVKLTQQDTPQYSLSKAFSILTPEQDLYDVLHLLKHIGGLISQ
ncbi:MAG: type I restriction endonuclease subunit R [Cyanobacteriota bacterium]